MHHHLMILCAVIALSAPVSTAEVNPIEDHIKPPEGVMLSGHGTIDGFHCEPTSPGKHPIVQLIHGCAPEGFGSDEYKRMCASLAEHGYYAMFVEFYSRTGQPNCRQFAMQDELNPGFTMPIPDDTWQRELIAAGSSLGTNPKADTSRFGVIGFSFGGTLATVSAMLYPDLVKAVVLYYPISTYRLRDAFDRHAVFPPTLILLGDSDNRAQKSAAEELDGKIGARQSVHELHVYAGADRGFNFREMNGYDASIAADAWRRTLAFLDSHLK